LKAVVLVGGKATRLEPLTLSTPKAMVPVLNIPFLEYIIKNLVSQSVSEIILALGHLSKSVEDYFGDGRRLGVKLHYSVEDSPLGSAGAVKKAGKFLNETFLVFNGDIVIDLDLQAMLDLHREKQAKVTIALTRVDDPTSVGLVITDSNNRVGKFLEKPSWSEVEPYSEYLINAGAWLVEPEVMSLVATDTQVSFERNVFPDILEVGQPFYAFITSGYWMDAGSPEKYLQLHRDLLGGKNRQYLPEEYLSAGVKTDIDPTADISGRVIIGKNCSIGPRSRLTGPVVIGDNCVIFEDCRIEDSVIWNNVRLELGVSLSGSIIADNCNLGSGSRGERVVLGDSVTVASNYVLESGSKVSPGTVLD